MLRDGWRIKANTDVNADAKNVYSFLEQHAGIPCYTYVPFYLHLTWLFAGSLTPRRYKCDIFICTPTLQQFQTFPLRSLSAIYSSWTWENSGVSGACCVIGISSNKNIPYCSNVLRLWQIDNYCEYIQWILSFVRFSVFLGWLIR